jgi:FKBP-type peptidyl-prolyl cis-trans isomerase FkpA
MMRTTITLLTAIVLLASCNQYQKTPSGLSYKITSGGSNEKLKQGQFVKFNIEYKVPPKDSVLSSSFGHMPAYMVLDTNRTTRHSFLEIITKCAVGDKIDFVMSVDTLKKMGMIEYNNIFHARDMIKGRVEILKAFTVQADAAADNKKEETAEMQREIKALKNYTDKKGIKTQSTPLGVLVEIQTPGDQAQKADSGKMAKVMYRGSLENGKPFDSNMDNPNAPPLMVLVGSTGGQNSVIPGMDEALRLFGKGGKGKLYIPSMLAYGPNGSGPLIPAYANLIFDVEIVDVTTPVPPAPQPKVPVVVEKKPKK